MRRAAKKMPNFHQGCGLPDSPFLPAIFTRLCTEKVNWGGFSWGCQLRFKLRKMRGRQMENFTPCLTGPAGK